MRLRRPAKGTDRLSSQHESGRSSSNPFRIDARIGHAWFARSDRPEASGERSSDLLPALRRAELALAQQGRAIARRAIRVPAEAIVAVGAALSSPPRATVETVAAAPDRTRAVANDNVLLGARSRTVLREVLFLLIFGATLAGTYYLGRMHAFYNVIVVPDASVRTNRVV